MPSTNSRLMKALPKEEPVSLTMTWGIGSSGPWTRLYDLCNTGSPHGKQKVKKPPGTLGHKCACSPGSSVTRTARGFKRSTRCTVMAVGVPMAELTMEQTIMKAVHTAAVSGAETPIKGPKWGASQGLSTSPNGVQVGGARRCRSKNSAFVIKGMSARGSKVFAPSPPGAYHPASMG